MTRTRRICVLFEHGSNGRPYGSSYIRLLRPFTHPSLRRVVSIKAGTDYDSQPVDAVIVDRGWRPDVTPALAASLRDRVHRAGARFVYAIDDNFFELADERKDWAPTPDFLRSIEFFLTHADGVIVTTSRLKEEFAAHNARLVVVPNMLDERLLNPWRRWPAIHGALLTARSLRRPRAREPLVIGYMGTLTHDDDLLMVLPALRAVCKRHPGRIAVEFIGVMARPETINDLSGLPWHSTQPVTSEYAGFMHWFSRHATWDIALAPLQDTPFNRFKSDIKFLDYAAIAAAGIYSRTAPYAASVQDHRTGILVDNTIAAWEASLEELVSDPGLRRAVGENALHYLYDERIVARMRRRWLEVFDQLLV